MWLSAQQIRGGGWVGLVCMSKTFYKGEMERLLADRSTYRLLSSDPMFQYKGELQQLIQYGKSIEILNIKRGFDSRS